MIPSPEDLIAVTERLIADVTSFDRRELGRNFSYDFAAYEEIRRNLGLLIASGQPRPATSLALELMNRGSHQVELSEEKMMTENVASGLIVAIEAHDERLLPASEMLNRTASILAQERVGFIARESLESLRTRLQRSTA